MDNHLDEMKLFLDLVHSYSKNILLENTVEEVTKEEVVVEENTLREDLVHDLKELKESWLSISSDDVDPSYSMGYEKGLYKAVEMLENMLTTKYNRRI